MKNVNLSENETMQVLRYANRVPLQFQPAACAITQSITATNWRSYGLTQSRGQLPVGPVTVMVHGAAYGCRSRANRKKPSHRIQKSPTSCASALQTVGRKLAMYLNRRKRVRQEGERREICVTLAKWRTLSPRLRSTATAPEKTVRTAVDVAKRKTAVADTQPDGEEQQHVKYCR